MTLPACFSWFPRGKDKKLCVPYEAPQGRRVNVIGAYFSHGPLSGRFCFDSFAMLPKHAREAKRKTPEEVAEAYGLSVQETGSIDAERFIDFIWRIAGRPDIHSSDWKRERPLMIVLDNYQVHKSQPVKEIRAEWERVDIYLVYLPSYSPELSDIEPIWNDVKHNQMSTRSYQQVRELKDAVDSSLAYKAERLVESSNRTTIEHRITA
jgi:putative transposase